MAREMKDSGVQWLGDVPSTWRIVRSKSLFRQRSSKGSESGELLAATQTRGMYPQRLLEGVVRLKEGTDLQQLKTVCVGDYVISLRSFQGGFEMSQYEGVCSPAYQVFYPYQDVDRDYFRYLFKSPRFIAAMDSLTVGIREGKNIRYQDFANSCVPVPPIDEQRRIADYLDAKCAEIDRAIEAAERSIDEYKLFRKAALSRVITHGIHGAACVPCWSEWIDEVPSHWRVVPLVRLARYISDGVHQTPTYVMDGVPFLSIKDISSGKISFADCKRIPYEEHLALSKSTPVEEGDVLFTRIGTLGVAVVVRDCPEFDIFVSVGIIKPNTDLVVPEFLAYVMQSEYYWHYIQVVKAGGQTAAAKFNLGDVRKSHIVLPPLEEQREIVAYLDDYCGQVDNAITAKQSIIDDLKAYKQSLVYEVVTGKREV